MKTWWQQLSSREQHYLLFGSSIVLISMAYFFIWSPFNNALNNRHNTVVYDQQLLSWMEQAQGQLQQLQTKQRSQKRVATEDLLSVIAQSLQENHLTQYAPQVQQGNDNKVTATFNSVAFDAFIHWLQQLWQAHTIHIDSLTLLRKDKAGLVQGSVVLVVSPSN